MMKKLLALLLCLTMCLPAAAAFGEAAEATEEPILTEVDLSEYKTPEVGETVNGFELKSVTPFEMIGAELYVYEHVKTGAQLVHISNEDNSRYFVMSFATPTENDKGTPHVFEHAVLDGSEKYPSKTLFFNLIYQTYNTDLNASTANSYTYYRMGSLSEEQLLKYVEYYTDSVLHPMLLEDESIFKEEAWRYELADADADLTLAGTVYSEMLGAMTLDSTALLNYYGLIFPGSHSSHEHGGLPADIPDLTWDDIKNFHAEYYHPSNATAFLYGNIEHIDEFLALLDGYFDGYEKTEITIEESEYTPITSAQSGVFDYPVEAGSDTDGQTTMVYGYVLGEMDEELFWKTDLLTTVLNSESSVLMQNLRAALPTGSFGCYVDEAGPELSVMIYATGLNEGDADTLKETVDASFKTIAEEGFDADAVDAIAASTRLAMLLANESSTLGEDICETMLYYYAATGDLLAYPAYVENMEKFNEWNEDGTFKSLVAEYLVDNERTALAVTRPVPGLKETQEAALAEKLAGVKAAMSEEEIAEIVTQTAEFGSEDEEDNSAEYVSRLQAVTVDSLPEEIREYEVRDTTDEDGVRHIDAIAEVDGVGQTMLLLDASSLTKEDLFWLKLYTDMLGSLDTENYTRAALSTQMERYFNGGTIKVSLGEDENNPNGFVPRVRITCVTLNEDMQASYDLAKEIFFGSRIDDTDRVTELVGTLKLSARNATTSSPYMYQLYRALGAGSKLDACYCALNYVDYYLFLSEVEEMLASDPAGVTAKLEEVRTAVANRNGAIVGCAGNEETIAAHTAAAQSFLDTLESKEIEVQTLEFDAPAKSEGIVMDLNIQFNSLVATWDQTSFEGYDGAMAAVTSLVSDALLQPMLRDTYGVYSVFHGADTDGVYIISYRDPNVAETFAVYDQLPELVKSIEVDQDTLDGYILSAYSGYAQSSGELTGAFSAMLSAMSNQSQEETLEYMRSLKTLDVSTIGEWMNMYADLVENGLRSTTGSASVIDANASYYEAVLNPFGVVAADAGALEDLPEDEDQAAAVTWVLENYMMSQESETAFGTESPAKAADFLTPIYVLIGGENDPAAAIEYLGGFGICPADLDPDSEITREQLVTYTWTVCEAFGVDVTADTAVLADYTDAGEITAGLEEGFAFCAANGLLNPAGEGLLAPQQTATRLDVAVALYVLFSE